MKHYDKSCITQDSKYTLFWKPQDMNGFCSQWYKCKIVGENNIIYNCAEQYMMAKKALLFDDYDVYDMIMKEKNPAQMKKYGRLVKNFKPAVWEEMKESIVHQGNLYKFTQNSDLKNMLLNTGDSILVEASPYDRIWGIGSTTEKQWNGENLLGFILMTVRDEIK